MYSALELIEKKRDRGRHAAEEFKYLAAGAMDASIPDYQLAAWLMAAFLNGLDDDEIIWFTEALASSGDMISYPQSDTIIDKHSTGGVGDKTTLVLVPLVAACKAKISKLSGPALGYTGGTVDKLESIPGIDLHLSPERLKSQVTKIGCAVSGHSAKLAPAEGIFYKLRDVTGTVPSIPLITSSILSKKLAGGAHGFLFDVKCGSGAFMQDGESAVNLARKLVNVSKRLGKLCAAVITDMEQPLGEMVGNSAEVYEAICVLKGEGPSDTRELCTVLGGHMLKMARVAETPEEGASLCAKALDDGSALEKFAEMVREQGGRAEAVYDPKGILPQARCFYDIKTKETGYLSRLSALMIGEGLRALGGGRFKHDDVIDRAVAVRLFAKIGDKLSSGETVMRIYYNTQEQLNAAKSYFDASWDVAPSAERRKLIITTIC